MTEAQMFQLFGLTFFAIGVGMFANPKFVSSISKELKNSTANIFYGGLISLVIGFFLISFHNVWTLNASLILTVMGWVALFKGLALLMFPKPLMNLYGKILRNRGYAAGYFVTGLGLLALFYGFMA